ncbi:MAG: ROK family transcriptional regulator [Firmicutes bacterium]|nr:ROK family transcriptional regulator [Bacillota bacterium]
MSRSELSKLMGVSRSTASGIVNELVEEGLLKEAGNGSSTKRGGKPPVLVQFDPSNSYVIGVFVEVEHTHMAVTDCEARVLKNITFETQPRSGPESFVERLRELVEGSLDDLKIRRSKILGIGIAVPGLADFNKGLVQFCPKLDGWKELPLARMVSDELGIPAYVENDTRAKLVGERLFGSCKSDRNVIMLDIIEGIGAAAILNNELYRGSSNSSVLAGHVPVMADGPRCSCGKRGCLEAVASNAAIIERVKNSVVEGDWGRKREEDWLTNHVRERLGGDVAGLTIDEVVEAFREGSTLAREVVLDVGEYVGLAVAALISYFDPDKVILSGKIFGVGEPLLEVIN